MRLGSRDGQFCFAAINAVGSAFQIVQRNQLGLQGGNIIVAVAALQRGISGRGAFARVILLGRILFRGGQREINLLLCAVCVIGEHHIGDFTQIFRVYKALVEGLCLSGSQFYVVVSGNFRVHQLITAHGFSAGGLEAQQHDVLGHDGGDIGIGGQRQIKRNASLFAGKAILIGVIDGEILRRQVVPDGQR